MNRFWTILTVIVALAMNLTMPDWHEADFVDHGVQRSQSDVFLDPLGELRTWMAKSVWLEVDVYHHAMESQGIPFRDEEGLMPLLKLVIMLDPTFEEAYATAGYHLIWNFHLYDEGMALLEQGLQRCPRSWPIRWERAFGFYHLSHFAAAAQAAQAALAVAPADLDRMNCLRLVLHSWLALRRYDLALETTRQMLRLWPQDRIVLQEVSEIRKMAPSLH